MEDGDDSRGDSLFSEEGRGDSLEVGRILGQAFRMCYGNPTRFILPAGIIGLLNIAMVFLNRPSDELTLGIYLLLFASMVLHTYYLATIPILAGNLKSGRFTSWWEALSWVRRKRLFWGVLWVEILYGFAIMVGLILLIIPGFIFASWYILALPARVLGDYRTSSALSESRRLIRPVFLGGLILACLLLIPSLISAGFAYIFPAVFNINQTSFILSLPSSILSYLLLTLWTPAITIALSITYMELKGGVGELREDLFE